MTQPTEEAAIDTRPWCRDHRGRDYSVDEFLKLTESFHGYPAPGVLIGAKMVDIAMNRMPTGVLFDAVCESSKCLPDAVQLLTPCTLGNGWLRVVPLGRYALTLFDKRSGQGIRVYVNPAGWSPILKPDTGFSEPSPNARTNPTCSSMRSVRLRTDFTEFRRFV